MSEDDKGNIITGAFGEHVASVEMFEAHSPTARPETPVDDTRQWWTIRDDECPLMFHGHRDGTYYIIDGVGQLRKLDQRAFSKVGVSIIFGGDLRWSWRWYPTYAKRKDGEEKRVANGIDFSRVSEYIMRKSIDKGLFDTTLEMRGVGVWRGEETDAGVGLVVHCGDKIFVNGEAQPAGFKIRHALYIAYPAVERPADIPASADTADRFLQDIRLWPWANDLHADLMFGWFAQSVLAGAHTWRAHAVIQSAMGTGKTTFMEMIDGALGAGSPGLHVHVSAPGLRQALQETARTFVYDEAENKVGGETQKVVDYVRTMSSREGGKVSLGTSDQTGYSTRVVGTALMAAIIPPVLNPADESRWLQLRMIKPENASLELITAAERAAKYWPTMSSVLRARMIQGWPRFQENFTLFKSAIIASKYSSRLADQYGVLLAGRHTMLFDQAASEQEVAAEIEAFSEILLIEKDLASETEGERCLSQIYSSKTDFSRAGVHLTVAELMQEVLYPPSAGSASVGERHTLEALGLRIDWKLRGREEPVLMVSNQHEGIKAMLSKTDWARGGHKPALLTIPGAQIVPKSVSFRGHKSRCIYVPPEFLPVKADNYNDPKYQAEDGVVAEYDGLGDDR